MTQSTNLATNVYHASYFGQSFTIHYKISNASLKHVELDIAYDRLELLLSNTMGGGQIDTNKMPVPLRSGLQCG
jgi:hypothetical protein